MFERFIYRGRKSAKKHNEENACDNKDFRKEDENKWGRRRFYLALFDLFLDHWPAILQSLSEFTKELIG